MAKITKLIKPSCFYRPVLACVNMKFYVAKCLSNSILHDDV